MTSAKSIAIIDSTPEVEALFAPLRTTIGDDYPGYRNHVYRVLTYALHQLGYDHPNRREVEAALVYHDVGMWTDDELAYLEPSIAQAERAAAEHGWNLDLDLVRNCILWHHKVFPYRGEGEEVVNAVRRADWVDATEGKVKMGLTAEQISAVKAALPAEGFYDALMRLASELSGGGKLRGLGRVLLRVYKW